MITSKSHELIKHIKALSQKKFRDEYNEYVVEGIKLVKEAIEEKQDITQIVISEKLKDSFHFPAIEIVSESVF